MNTRIAILLVIAALSACGADDDAPTESGRLEDDVRRPNAVPDEGAEGMPAPDDIEPEPGSPSDPEIPPEDVVETPPDDTTPPPDAPDPGLPARTMIPPSTSRGNQWVRNNPMFVSGLVVSMPAPDATVVNRYYDEFGATSIHLWQTGIGPELDAWLAVPRNDHRWLSWTRRDGKSGANLQLAGGMPPNSPGRVGFQVGDEPRTWAEFEEMVVGVKALRQHDPGALVFVNMAHQVDELDRMMEEQCNDPDFDVISYDDYSVRQGQYEWLTYFRDWGLRCDKPYWRYLVSYGDAGDPNFKGDTDMRWHAMTGVLFGYTGHSWFLYNINNGDSLVTQLFATTGTWSAPTAAHDVAASINVELNHLGKTLTQLTSTDVRYNPSYSFLQPDSTQPWEPGAGDDPYLTSVSATGHPTQENAISFFRDDWGDIYIAVLNPTHEGGSYQVRGTQNATVRLAFDLSTAPANVSRAHLQALDNFTGGLTTVPLVAGPTGHVVDVVLEPGELRLLKYDTGYPFVGAMP